MSLWQLATRSLRHFWRTNLALLLGIAVGTAVLTGALVVGDSVRDSLRALTIERLGRIDDVLLGEHFFRRELAESLTGSLRDGSHYESVVPVILLNQVTVELDSAGQAKARMQGVTLVGCEPSFWQLDAAGAVVGQQLGANQIAVNRLLADELGAQVGDRLLVRVGRPSGIAEDSPLARKEDLTETIANLEIVEILPSRGLARFSLRASQQIPAAAFVSLETLQLGLDQPGKVNALLASGTQSDQAAPAEAFADLRTRLAPELGDLGLSLRRIQLAYEAHDQRTVVSQYDSLSSDRMLFSDEADRAVREAFGARAYQSVFTYLATKIQKLDADNSPVGEIVPYSTVAAVDSNRDLGPLTTVAGEPVQLEAGRIGLNSWAADVLQAKVGDRVRVTYFAPETTHGETIELNADFELRDVAPVVTPRRPFTRRSDAVFGQRPTLANDPDLTPTVPGITDQESIANWDAPFRIDYQLLQRRDDVYWDNFRTTPKAFLSLAEGRRLWASRFGQTTSYRLPVASNETLESRSTVLARALAPSADAFGLRWMRAKRDGLAASRGTTPFDALFLGFSMFIIASALMLVSLLLRLGLETRASQLGLMAALGFDWKRSFRLLLAENALLTCLGSAAGVVVGIGYAWLMLVGLRTWWLAAVVTPFMELSVRPLTLLVGGLLGVAASLATIGITLWRLRKVSPARLLTGSTEESTTAGSARPRAWQRVAPGVLFLLAGVLAVFAPGLAPEPQAGAFFGAGSCVLTAILLLVSSRLRRAAAAATDGADLDLSLLAARNLTRNPTRSTLTIGLVAAACFLIVAMSAFRLAPTEQGTGGFSLVGQSDQPIFVDLQDPAARRTLLDGADADELTEATVFPLRLQDGDDASCRNLYQSARPRLIGVTQSFVEKSNAVGEMEWAAVEPGIEGPGGNWRVLAADASVVDDAIPVVLDKNTAMYSLQLFGGVGEVFQRDYGAAGVIKFRVAGLLAGSIFQGSLLIRESDLLRRFPRVGGYRFFLVAAPAGQEKSVGRILENAFSDQGLDLSDTKQLLTELLAVQNTYLSTFQSLGGLGLLLGTFGLAAVQLRNVVQRRGELALLRATGFRNDQLTMLVLREHALLLLGGLAVGGVAALVVVFPHLVFGGASIPFGSLLVTLGLVTVVGLASAMVSQRYISRTPLLPALRGD